MRLFYEIKGSDFLKNFLLWFGDNLTSAFASYIYSVTVTSACISSGPIYSTPRQVDSAVVGSGMAHSFILHKTKLKNQKKSTFITFFILHLYNLSNKDMIHMCW